jgi:ribosomal protein S18 acetylase RimI-like enzyme
MPDVKPLRPDEWPTLRGIRLSALRESPDAFLATYERENAYKEDRWQQEFSRGQWWVGYLGVEAISLLGVTREPDTPPDECYLEYLWVAPEQRRSGIALTMLNAILGRLRASGVRTVYLWVLDRNEAARSLYKRVGFVSSNHSQPLPERPDRTEERMQLDLAEAG